MLPGSEVARLCSVNPAAQLL